MNIHALISFTVALVNLFIGFNIYIMDRHERLNKIFFLGMIFMFFFCITEGFLRLASNEELALLFDKLFFFFAIWLPVLSLYFVFNITRRRERWTSLYFVPTFFFALILASDIFFRTALFISGVSMGKWGFYGEMASAGYYLYMAYLLAYFLLGSWILFVSFLNEGGKEEKRRFLIVLLGALLPIMLGGGAEALRMLGYPVYPLASISTTLFILLFFAAGFHKRLFTPQPEEISPVASKYNLEPKMSFVTFDQRGFEIFYDMITHGHEGLIVTSKSQSEVESTYGLKKTSVIFLAFGEDKHSVAPEDLSKLGYYIVNFLKESKKSMIYLEGFNKLLEKNGFNHTLRFLHTLNDSIVVYSSTLLLYAEDESLSEIERNLLMREFTLVKKEAFKDSYLFKLVRI